MVDTSSEQYRIECMQRAVRALLEFMSTPDMQARRDWWMKYREKYGQAAAKELLNMERGVKSGRIQLDQFK